MADNNTRIDIRSLEDFRKALDSRLASAQTALTAFSGSLSATSLPAGSFEHAKTLSGNYTTARAYHKQRIQRLISAIEAAQAATDTIIENYTTTEARNSANVADIAALLGDVGTTLDGGDAA